jgi:DNA-3-methyladenine glycosylase
MNAVTESDGRGAAVLIRAIEPIWGVPIMQANRGFDDHRRLTRGPAMLCQALQVNRNQDGIDLTSDPTLLIAYPNTKVEITVATTPRIGISKAQASLLRFVIRDNPFVRGRRSADQ